MLNEAIKKMMSELYLQNDLFPNKHDWDPNPCVGYVQLRAYISFLSNQIKRGFSFSLV